MTVYSKLIGTGSYLPERVFSNADFEKIIDTTDEWIVTRSGIKNRHFVADDESIVDMVEIASRRAMEAAGLAPDDLDGIIIGTTSGSHVFPSTANELQARLGITNHCPSFDLQAACSGFMYSLSVADQFIKTGHMKTVLVLGAEVISKFIDWKDRSTCVLFGDGAGAAIFTASKEPGILSTHIHSDGRFRDLLYADNSFHLKGEMLPRPTIKMQGKEVFKVAVNTLSDIVEETLTKNHLSKQDIDWLVPHQANLRIIQASAKKLDLPMERVIVTLHEQGNTSAASVPLAFDEGIRDGRIKAGELVMLEAFGGGLTWGSALIRI
jgi:3-oxoacyl-[acyl-carrier-protein] synthase III